MSTHLQLTLLALTTLAFGCTRGNDDRESIHGEAALAAPKPGAMQMARLHGERALRDAARSDVTVGGLLSVFDDPLTNTHGFSQALFFNQRVPVGCTHSIPIEGGTCERFVRCDPPEPDFSGQLVNVGEVRVASTFDAFDLAPAFFHDAESRNGPFWRGDGDSVAMSFAGTDAIPAWSTTMHAPVADAVGHVPEAIDRTAGITLDWRYAVGDGPAVGNMAVFVAQTDPPTGSFECIVPMTQRSMKIPAQMMARFQPGPGIVMMTSTATKSFGAPVGTGNMQIVVALTGTVDIGNPDPNDANVTFR